MISNKASLNHKKSLFLRFLLWLEDFCLNSFWLLRCSLLNKIDGISISKDAFIDKSAKLEIRPGREFYGGKIHISANSRIMQGSIISPYGGSIHINENVFIGPYCVIYGHGGLTIGKDTMIATHTVIIPSNHSFSRRNITISNQPTRSIGITIGDDVWIGCGVRILDGVFIGRGCVVGAGSVVTKSLPDYSIAVGVPAKIIGNRS